jgi:transposase InsO family protein
MKRVYRIWIDEGLKVPRKTRKKRALGHGGNACHVRRAKATNDVWCWDFIYDRTVYGQSIKWLAIQAMNAFEFACVNDQNLARHRIPLRV